MDKYSTTYLLAFKNPESGSLRKADLGHLQTALSHEGFDVKGVGNRKLEDVTDRNNSVILIKQGAGLWCARARRLVYEEYPKLEVMLALPGAQELVQFLDSYELKSLDK